MQDLFLAFIQEKKLFSADDKVLLAVSGGLDSVVLAHLFSQSPYLFGIAHVNFGLRGEESDGDAHFVAALAKELGVPFFSVGLEAAQAARESKISIQMAARELRYNWFRTICQQEGYAAVATAHHLNDLTETLLLNLSRGTGIAGLHGILPKRGKLVRPLLFATRQELESYARLHQLAWREDSSNSSLKYRRNKIRQQVVPLLKELNPRIEASFLETATRIGAAERVLQQLVEQVRQQVLKHAGKHYYLHITDLLNQAEPLYLLAELLAPFGASWSQATQILHSLQQEQGTVSGKWFATPTHKINLDREQLIISPLEEQSIAQEYLGTLLPTAQELVLAQSKIITRRLSAKEYRLQPNAHIAALDFHKLNFPLQLRHPAAGDRFQPLGMRGKKKLSDFMIDHKIPVNLKNEVLLVISDQEIAWVAGYRPDERFKVDAQTQEIFEIRLIKP